MPSFSSLLMTVSVLLASAHAIPATSTSSITGGINVWSNGYPAGCVNANGALIEDTSLNCAKIFTGVVSGQTLSFSTANGPCGMVDHVLNCAPSTKPTAFSFSQTSNAEYNIRGSFGGEGGAAIRNDGGTFQYSLQLHT